MCIWAAVAAGCVLREPGGTDTGPDETGATTSTTAEATTDEAPTTSTTASATTAADTGTTTPATSCGDGVVDVDEFCDDGNLVGGDGCNADCRPSAELLWEFRSDIFIVDEFRDVAVAGDGTIVAGGRWLGEGAWLTRFTAEGEGLWSRTYGLSSFDAIQGLVVGEATIDVVGMRQAADRDAWIAHLDGDGEIVWEETIDSGFGDDFAIDVSRTPGGDLVVVGVRSVDGGLGEIWVRRHAPAGAVQWTQTRALSSGPLYEIGPAVSAAADPIVVGFVTGPDPAGELLFALQPGDGAPLWSHTAPRSTGTIRGLARAPNGDILSTSSAQFVRRSSSVGETSWARTGCTIEGRGLDAAVDSQGDVIAIGYAFGDVLLCKFTADGELRWERTIEGGGEGYGHALALMPDDRIVAAGQVANGQTQDAWLAMFSP